MITPSPKVDIYLLYRKQLILSFSENPEYHFYLRNPNFNHFSNNYGTELSFPFLRSLVISSGYSSQSYRHLMLDELDRQVEMNSKRIRVEISFETLRRLSWTLGGYAQELSYSDFLKDDMEEDALAQNLDRQEFSGHLEIRYDAFRGSRLFFRFGYIRHDFPSAEAGWKDAETASFLTGIRFPELSRLFGNLAIGFKRFLAADRSLPRFSGLIIQSQVGINLGAATLLSLGYNRDTSFSYWKDVLYYIRNSFNATLTTDISRFLDIRIGGNYTRLSYPHSIRDEGVIDSGPLSGWGDRYASFQAGFTIPILKKIRAGLTYQYWTRPSGLLGSGDGHLITINFVRK